MRLRAGDDSSLSASYVQASHREKSASELNSYSLPCLEPRDGRDVDSLSELLRIYFHHFNFRNYARNEAHEHEIMKFPVPAEVTECPLIF